MSDTLKPKTVAEVLAMFGATEGRTRTEAPFIRESYAALDNGSHSVYVISDAAPDEMLTLLASVASDDTLVTVVDCPGSKIAAKLNYRNTATSSDPDRVTYGSAKVVPVKLPGSDGKSVHIGAHLIAPSA